MKKIREEDISILQIKISLMGSNPIIWRRFLVSSNFTIKKFHELIQIVMGWENYHLYQFLVGKEVFSENKPEYEGDPKVRSTTTKLSKVIKIAKKMIYEYDFGDGWEHEILIEKIMSPDDTIQYPICIGGENACPPEDCGGIWGYYQMIEALNDPDHEEHESTTRWLGGFFDPKSFDFNRINRDMLWTKRW